MTSSILQPVRREQVLPEPELPDPIELKRQGETLAGTWKVEPCEFLKANNCSSEAQYKRQQTSRNRIMQHAHMGFRDKVKSLQACSRIYEETLKNGAIVDRYGICLDWSMGFPKGIRADQLRGTGLVLDDVASFVELTNQVPVAPHFGDFMLGFPAALENTQYALSAGATTIGNLGQYFTFQLPNWKDDIETTVSTLTAISLMAAQSCEVMVHSNLDDGFAGVLRDLSCALGAAKLEKYLVEDLLGAKLAHCYGHHYSTPVLRYAFHQALHRINPQPGSMIYGNTTSYKGNCAQNFASMAGYLLVDLAAQRATPSGHAVNPVPVSENKRIPDIDEIIEAQLYCSRLTQVSDHFTNVVDTSEAEKQVDILLSGAELFFQNLIRGFDEGGIDTANPVEMFLAIRRVGGKRLEALYGPGEMDDDMGTRKPWLKSDTVREIDDEVIATIKHLEHYDSSRLKGNRIKIVVATTDVHEHAKQLLQGVFRALDMTVVDGGISVDPDDLATLAEATQADAIALTTYNGVALTYFGNLKDELDERGLDLAVLIGGQLNEIPKDSENSLPQDVTSELENLGAVVCHRIEDAMPCLIQLSGKHQI